jgi:glutamyl-tRNA reductase
MFLIDIAVPRNIDPAVNELEFVFLYDIDDLQKVVDSNRRTRHQEAEDAERIVAEEVRRTVERLLARDAAPLIVSLQKQLEAIRTAELERIRAKLGALTPQQEEAIEALTRGIINKIAHAPIAELRRAPVNSGGESSVDVIRRIFRIET